MFFIRKNDLLYYINQLTNVKRLCILKNCVRDILKITHDNDHAESTRIYEIIVKL